MPSRQIVSLLLILAIMTLSACQEDHETPQTKPAIAEKPVVTIEQPAEQTTTAPINLDVTQQSLEQLYNDEDQHITADAPVRITKQQSSEQKTKISGGVLLDEERGVLTDGVESIDGAEVKISVPLH